MFNYPFGNLLYYPIPNSSFGLHPQQSFIFSMLPSFSPYQDFKSPENLDRGIFPQQTKKESQNISTQSKVEKTESKKFDQYKLSKKIKKQRRCPNKSPKKTVFKNCYLSFSTHKLLTFISNKACSEKYLEILVKKSKSPKESYEKTIKVFYQQHDHIMKYIINNASIRKLRELWTGELLPKVLGKIQGEDIKFYSFIYRSLSKIYFDQFYCCFILRSKKVRKLTVPIHLKMRNYLLENLKSPNQFVCYQGFQ